MTTERWTFESGLIAVRASTMLLPEDGRLELTLPAGMTVADIVAQSLPRADAAMLDRVRVTVVNAHGMAVVERAWWDRVRVREGTTVVVRLVPGDDGLRQIMSIVVSIAALAVSTFLAPYLAPVFGGGAFGLNVARTVLGVGTLLAGTLAVNALIPPPEEPDPPRNNYVLQGWRNSLNPGGVVPVVLGKMRYAPPFAVKPYTEIIDGKQYLCAVFCYGYGPVSFSGHRIGETPLDDFEDFKIEERAGRGSDNPLTLVTRQVIEEAVGTELVKPFPRNDAGEINGDDGIETPVKRVLARDCTMAGLILLFPQGEVRVENDGDFRTVDMNIRVRSRPVTGGAWTYSETITISRATRDPFYVQHRWKLDPRGTYEVEVTRMTNEATSTQKIDRVQLLAIQSFRPEYPLNFDAPLALVAIRIKASYQLNGMLDSFNSIIAGLHQDYDHDSDNWSEGEARNPASHYRYVLQGPANAKAQGNSKVDLDGLEDWHDFCRINGLKYDRVHDSEASLESVLRSIAAAGRATPRFDGRKWGVVIDRPQTIVVDQINPRNSKAMSWSRSYLVDRPDAYRVPFLDRTNDYKPSERLIPWPGVAAEDIVKTERLDMPGKTDPVEIWIEARRYMHSRRYRPDEIRVTQDGAARVATRGDLVMLNHDVLVAAQKAARVLAINGAAVELDDMVTMEAGTSYAIRWQAYDANDTIGESILRGVMTFAGSYQSVILIDASLMPPVGAVVHFGTLALDSEPMVVRNVESGTGMTSILSLVAPADLIDADTDAEEPPAWNGRVGAEIGGLPDEPGKPTITRVLSGVSGTGNADGLWVLVAANDDSDVETRKFEIDHKPDFGSTWTTVTVSAAAAAAEITGYSHGDSVDLRARARSSEDTPGPYSDVVTIVIGETDVALPTALPEESIVVTGRLGWVSIEGIASNDALIDSVQVYRSASDDSGDLDLDTDRVGKPIAVLRKRPWLFSDGDPTRENLVLRGNFASGKGWTKGAGWSVGDDVATHAPGSASAISRGVNLAAGIAYRMRVDIEEIAAGTVTPRLTGGGSPTDGATINGIGRHYDRLVAASGNDTIEFLASSDFDGAIDDVVLFRETAACLDQGTYYYYFAPLNVAGVAGPLTSAFAATVT